MWRTPLAGLAPLGSAGAVPVTIDPASLPVPVTVSGDAAIGPAVSSANINQTIGPGATVPVVLDVSNLPVVSIWVIATVGISLVVNIGISAVGPWTPLSKYPGQQDGVTDYPTLPIAVGLSTLVDLEGGPNPTGPGKISATFVQVVFDNSGSVVPTDVLAQVVARGF